MSMFNINKVDMNTQIRGYLENITLGIIGGLLTNVIAASIINNFIKNIVLFKQYKTIVTVIIVLIVPVFANYLFHRFNFNWSRRTLVSVTIVIILLESLFFTVLPSQEINIKQNYTLYPQYSKYFEGVPLRNTSHNKAWILDDSEFRVFKDELHILLKVEWEKEGKIPGLTRRNYQGYIYYQIDLACTLPQDKTEMTTKMISYSFRPGSGILSYNHRIY